MDCPFNAFIEVQHYRRHVWCDEDLAHDGMHHMTICFDQEIGCVSLWWDNEHKHETTTGTKSEE